MSGPIIRKYGFPNHEQIFGKSPMKHGADAEVADDAEADAVKPAAEKAEKAPEKEKKPKAGPKKKK
jgi:hypothetical protein